MKRIKELTWEQTNILIEQCKYGEDHNHECDESCPLFGECYYYYTGDDTFLYKDEEVKKEEK